MAQKLIRKTKGLYRNTNELSESPEGSLLIADNVVIDRDSIIESRRGFNELAFKFRDSTDRALNLFNYQTYVLAHNSTDLMSLYDPEPVDLTADITSASNVITNIAPNTDDLTVGQTVYGSYRFTITTVADVSGSLNSTYFLFNSANNETRYYIYFSVDGAGIDPNISIRTPILVNISANDTADTVASAIQAVIDPLSDFVATVLTNVVTVTNAATGDSDIARNAASPLSPGFTFNNIGTGIADGTVIDSIDSASQVTLSQNITDTRTGGNISVAGWRNYNGTYEQPNPDYGRIRSAEANQNFYFVSDTGVKKLDTPFGTIIQAGGTKALDGSAELSGSTGFQEDDTQVAYRIVWGYKDANDNLILGTPSNRIISVNTSGGTRDVQLTIYIPEGITTDYFYQIYRSGQSATANDAPNDECIQVAEDNPSQSAIDNGELVVIDSTPEDLRNGASLYTNESQEGIAQANEPPPFAEDIAIFKDCLFYANTRTLQNLYLTMLAVSGTKGVSYSNQAATYVNATSFTVPSDTGLTPGMLITGPGANFPAGIYVSTITGAGPYTITVTGGVLTAWGLTVDVQFRDVITINGTSYYTNDLTRTLNRNVTITNASPAKVQWTGHGLTSDSTVYFTTTGTLPSPLLPNTTYYVVNPGVNDFEVSLTQAGASINTTTAGSGTHTAVANDLKFEVITSGTPAQNIADTSLEFVRVVNSTDQNTTIYAYYLSGPDELPGQMKFEARNVAVSQFSATTTSHNDAWNPVLPTSGTSVASTNDRFLNGLYFSKSLQPEAVPLTNYLLIGSADKKITRIVALRDSLFVFKEDGIFRILGTQPTDFRPDLLDNTTKLIASESAVALNNQVFGLIDQGVGAVSDTGVAIVSRSIENDFLDLFSLDLTDVAKLSFAVAYESDRKYILSIISSEEDTYPTQSYVYNTFTQAWTKWTISTTCGLIGESNDRLLFGDAVSNAINIERKARDFSDYVDNSIFKTLAAQDGRTLTLNNLTGIVVGDGLSQGNTVVTTVESIDTVTNTVVLQDTVDFVIGEQVQIHKAILTTVEYIPEDCDNPGMSKQVREISMFFKDGIFDDLTLSFTSDTSRNREEVALSGFLIGFWGLFPWGSTPWGGITGNINLRTYIPPTKQRCSQLSIRLTHQEAFSFYALNGLSLVYNNMSERIKR